MPQRLNIEDTIDQVYSLIKQKNDALLDRMYKQLYSEFNDIRDDIDNPYTIYIQFKAMACIVSANIYANNSDAISYECQMLYAFDKLAKEDKMTEGQLFKIYELLHKVVNECNNFCKDNGFDLSIPDTVKNFGKIERKYENIEHKSNDKHNCYLCNIREGIFKGSHMAPNFLIQPFLTSDKTIKRDKEIVTEILLRDNKKDRKWGRRVSSEDIQEQFGDIPEEEMTQQKTSALTRDNFFCHECEKRFGYFETLYAQYFRGQIQNITPVISYLFWLGVFWRLSKANMCVKMNADDEECIRSILDNAMPFSLNDMRNLTTITNQGMYCYTIIHCTDTKSERNVILGSHNQQPPYYLVIGSYIITLYRNKDEAKGVTYYLNDSVHHEKIQDVEFLEFWTLKQKIMNNIQKYEYSNMGKQGVRIADIAYGGYNDNLSNVFNPLGGKEELDIKSNDGKYVVIYPGAVVKLLSYQKEHPFDSVEEFWEGFEKQYGYSKADMEAIVNETLDENNIKPLQSDESIKRHKMRKQRGKALQKKNKKRLHKK